MNKSSYATPCGLFCLDCKHLKTSCKGKPCMMHDGKVFWGTCEIYNCCVKQKKLEHCGKCEEFPCKLFLSYTDPNLTPKEAEAENKRKQKALRRRAKIGTEAWVKEYEE